MNSIILPKAQAFRYLWLLIGIGFMIMSIRVYLNNYLTIENSIKQTQQDIIHTQSETDFIKNFQLSYLQSQLAQRNLMHQQQIVDKWGKLILMNYITATTQGEETIDKWWDTLTREWWINFIAHQRNRSVGN